MARVRTVGAMRILLWLNHVLIVLFAISSGIFKVMKGPPDLEVFAHLGMGPGAVQLFGAVQALGGLGLVFARTSKPAAAVVVLCNLLATAGLFAAGVQPFGAISLLFVAMAALEWRLTARGAFAVPPA